VRASIWALVKKDFREHATHLLGFLVVIATSQLLPLLLGPGGVVPTLSLALLPVAFLFPMFIAYWLIGMEKAKRTLFLLRLLPLSAHHLAIAKEVVALSMLLLLGAVVVVARSLVLSLQEDHEMDVLGSFGTALARWIPIVMVLLTQLALFLYLWLDYRLAGIIIVVIWYSGVFLAFFYPNELMPLARLSERWSFIVVGHGIAVLLVLGLHFLMVRLLERKDWDRLATG